MKQLLGKGMEQEDTAAAPHSFQWLLAPHGDTETRGKGMGDENGTGTGCAMGLMSSVTALLVC